MKPIILFLFFFPATLLAYNFDYYQLVLQWPPTFCSCEKKCIDYPQNFTIHGLWPSNLKRPSPWFCYGCQNGPIPWVNPGTSQILNLSWISSATLQTLRIEWPDLLGYNERFWGREWYKHGTCSKMSVPQYFNNALELRSRVDLLAEITPGQSYYLTEIKQAIKSQTDGKEPHLRCIGEESNQLLLEVSICFDFSQLNFMNCPTALLQQGLACSSIHKVFFPEDSTDTVQQCDQQAPIGSIPSTGIQVPDTVQQCDQQAPIGSIPSTGIRVLVPVWYGSMTILIGMVTSHLYSTHRKELA